MNATNKILIEQCLSGMHPTEPLSGEEFLIESLCEYLDNENPGFTMNEAVGDLLYLTPELAKYSVMVEAVDAVKAVEIEYATFKNKPDEGKFKKFIEKVKQAIRWYYTIDPNSKAANFRLIGKIIYNAVIIVLNWKLGGAAIANKVINAVTNVGSRLIGNKTGTKLTGQKDKAANTKQDFFKASKLNTAAMVTVQTKDKVFGISIILFLLNAFASIVEELDKQLMYKINVTDVDSNISKYKRIVKELDAQIELSTGSDKSELMKAKADTVKAISELETVRAMRDAKKKPKGASGIKAGLTGGNNGEYNLNVMSGIKF